MEQALKVARMKFDALLSPKLIQKEAD